MKLKSLYVVFFMLLTSSLFSQNWNLVWREDFGIAEDTIMKNFPDPTMSVAEHIFFADAITKYTGTGTPYLFDDGAGNQCRQVIDGTYAITNSVKWAYTRPASCHNTSDILIPGRDHTGNDKGAMLLVNSGAGIDREVYSQDINFQLCNSRKYRFGLYASSVTHYGTAAEVGASLTLQVVNKTTGVVVGSVETGDIPLWDRPSNDPFQSHVWSYYYIDFTANSSNTYSLKVINHKPSGSGNDFVIDDISLFRDDQYDIPTQTISTSTISSESVSVAGLCVYDAVFSIPSETVTAWANVYNYTYYVWQKSSDDGLTWTNMTEYSGINKNTITMKNMDVNSTDVYRVVISGGYTAADAKTQAEYVAANGGPQDGCSYFSISNILAGVSPEIDCSYKDGLKAIWQQDFGVAGVGQMNGCTDVKTLNLFKEKISSTEGGHSFGSNASSYPEYALVSDPSTAFEYCDYHSWESSPWYCGQKSNMPVMHDASGNASGAFLYMVYQNQSGKVLYEKTINGPFCNCKSYQFSFAIYTPGDWSTVKLLVEILDAGGNTLASQQVTKTQNTTWDYVAIPFSVAQNYSGAVTIRIKANSSDWIRYGIDNMKVCICSEKVPVGTIMIDNTSGQVYKGGFQCGTEVHYVNIDNVSQWSAAYPSFGKAWQKSLDGGVTWSYVSSAAFVTYNSADIGFVQYRAVFAETQSLADAVAKGTNTDGCSMYGFSNTVGFNCTVPTCNKPVKPTITSTDADNILCKGATATLTPASQTSATLFSYTWYKGSIADANIIAGPTVGATLAQTVSETGTYIVVAADKDAAASCNDSSKVTITVKDLPTVVSVTGGSDYCNGKTVTAPTFTFSGTAPFSFSYSDTKNSYTNKTATTTTYSPSAPSAVGEYTYTISALADAYCTATALTGSTTIKIKEQPSVTASNNGSVCAGSSVTLTATCATPSVTYLWSGPNSYSSSLASPTITSTTTAMSGDYTVKVSLNGCEDTDATTVTINAIPTITQLTVDDATICPNETATVTATVSDSGDGHFTWTNATGSGKTATVSGTVTAQETRTVTLAYTSAANCPAANKTATVTLNPKPAIPGVQNLSFCIGDASQTLTATPASGATLLWYGTYATGGSSSTTAPSTNTSAESTTTYYVSQELNGCESDRAGLTVTVNANLDPTITIDDATLCITDATKISLPQAASYTSIVWSGTALSFLNNPSLAAPTFTAASVTNKTDYTITVAVEDAKGCKGTKSGTISVYPTPMASLIPDKTTLCKGTTTAVTANVSETGGTGAWTGATEDTETTATFTASTEGAQAITYVYTSQYGCKSAVANTSITVNPIPAAPTTKTFSKCLNDATESLDNYVTAASGATLLWYSTSIGGTGNATAPTPSTANAVTGDKYYVSQVVTACESATRGEVTVIVMDKLYPTISVTETSGTTANDGAVCHGTAASLSLGDTYTSQTWSCDDNSYLSAVDIANPTFKSTVPVGNYTVSVSVTNAAGCKGQATKAITVNAVPTATLSALTNECKSVSTAQTLTATITPTGLSGTGTWTGDVTKASETTATFTPSLATATTHPISYSFKSDAGCAMATAATTSVEVFAMPNISITPSVTGLCESGGSVSAVTMKMTGTYNTTGTKTQTYNYTSATLTGVNATTGAFNSTGQTAATHTISLAYTDANGCAGSASTQVTIHARPVADISANATALCDYASPISLTAKINGATSTEGTFAGMGVSGKTFTPSSDIKGLNTITFNYTDGNGCSAAEVNHTITVNHTDAPDVQSASASNLDVTNQSEVPNLSATGTDIQWYLAADTTTTVVASTADYQLTFVDANTDGKMDVGTYSAYATQTLNGCQSIPAEGTLTITDCKAKAPTAQTYHACVAGASDLEIMATSNQTSADNFCWFIDKTSVPSGTVASLTEAQAAADASGATYTVTKDQFSASKTITVYVAEYYEADHCFSAATPVNVLVHVLPNPKITNPGVICSTTNEITVAYAPTTGGSVTSTLSGTGLTGNVWTTQYNASATGTTQTTIQLATQEVWGSGTGAATCENTTSEIFEVTNVLAPTGTGIGTPQVWSVSKIASLPAMTISYADGLSATLSVKNEGGTEIGTSSPITMYSTHISGEGSYEYTVTQTLNGCKSAVATSTWNIVECPTPEPSVSPISICAGDALPTIMAIGTGTTFEWIDSVNASIGSTAALNVATIGGYTSKAGTYTFQVRQDGDDGAGGTCFGPYASVAMTVNSLPEIVINPLSANDVLCYAAGKKAVQATVNGTSTSLLTGGTWAMTDKTLGTAVAGISTDGIVDPSVNGKNDGTYTVSYTYTDGNGCVNSQTKDFSVEYPEILTTTPYNGIIAHPVAVEVTATNIETDAIVSWYNTDKTTFASNDNPWETGDDGTAVIDKTYWVSQTVRGCESEKASQSVIVVSCPWAKPMVTNDAACSGKDLQSMSAIPQTGITVEEWKWYDADGNSIVNNSSSYTQTNNTMTGTTSYFVAYTAIETSSGIACESPRATVTTTIHALPIIKFTETASSVCYTSDAEEIEVSVDYGTNGAGAGTWSVLEVADAISNAGIFNPKKNGAVSDTYTIRYSYVDGKSCQDSADRSISVIYLAAPTTTNHFSMTTQNTDAVVSAELNGGTTIRWYNTVTGGTQLGQGTSWTTGDKGNVVVNKDYYAAQEKEGCYSDRTAANVSIIACPVPSVVISDDEACVYAGAPQLTATAGTWTATRPAGSVFRFYDAATDGTLLKETADGTYTPSLSVAGPYSYWVSEYNGNIAPIGCEGPRKKVTITMKETAKPSITAEGGLNSVCLGTTNPTFIANAAAGDVYWYEENPGASGEPQVASSASGLEFIPAAGEEGLHSLWAVRNNNGCYSASVESQYTVKPNPIAPQTTNNEICFEKQPKTVTATGAANATIVWYADATQLTELQRGTETYQPKQTMVGTYTFYVLQIVDGCAGPTAEAQYKIKSLPSAPQVSGPTKLCEYDAAPTLSATGENIVWYASDKITQLATGNSFQTSDMTVGSHPYYASQTVDGCEGPSAPISYTVGAKPTNPIVKGASMCAGDVAVPTLESSLAIDKWYSEENVTETSYLATGKTYVPALETLTGTTTYYVQREQNGCVSSVIPVVMNVIAQPDFSIGKDVTMCVYESAQAVQAQDFTPEITANSYIAWTITSGDISKAYIDNEQHTLDMTEVSKIPGTYTISANYRYRYDNKYCNSETKIITYTVKKRPRTPIVFSTVICNGEKIKNLQAMGTPNMTWISLSGTTPSVSTGTVYQFDQQDLNTGTYQFEVFDNEIYDTEQNLGCESLHDTVSMEVAPAAKTNIFGSDSVCIGATESYYTQYTQGSTYLWNVSGGHLNYAKTDATSVRYVDWTKSGVDTLTVFEQTWAGCQGYDTVIVKIASNPVAKFTWHMPGSSNVIALQDSTIQDSLVYTNAEGQRVSEEVSYTMSWNYGHQGESEDAVDFVVPYKKRGNTITEGDYVFGYNCPILAVENSFGCKDSYSECIYVNITSSLFVPNAFSPTNPAESVRTFHPVGYNLETCEFSIYDKWGNLLWYSNKVENGTFMGSWDGRYNGEMMMSGVYIWKMEATFLDGQEWKGFDDGKGNKTKFGSVTLIR